jgi:hypothetical protein
MELIRIGYWNSSHETGWPDVLEMIDESVPQLDRFRVVDYLRRGMLAERYRGYSWCRICGLEENGSCEFTDGTYIWPEGLAHYVSEHYVKLPDAFRAHVDARVAEMREAVIDTSWWASVGADRASGSSEESKKYLPSD